MAVAERASIFSLLSNIVLMILKFVVGVLGNSFALIADAVESAADVVGSFLVLLGLRYANRPADANHPYGHGRVEPLVTFGVVGMLLVSASIIGFHAIQNIQNPDGQSPHWFTALFLVGVIVWKEISFQFILRKSKETHSSSLKADAWHHRSDAITSLAALIGIGIILIFGEAYSSADDWAALFAACFIIYNAYLIFRPALGEMMDENVYDDIVLEIRDIAANVPGVSGTEKCIVRKVGMVYHIDLHTLVSGDISVTAGHQIAHQVIDAIQLQMTHAGRINIHIEPDSCLLQHPRD